MSLVDLEPSRWRYETGATGGIGIEFVALSGGAIYLDDPTGKVERFFFGGLGAGLSFGFKIPKLPKLQLRGRSLAGAGSTKDFPSRGRVWKRSRFNSRELTKADIQGAVVFVEGAIGLGVGASGDAMLFGINPVLLALAISNPMLQSILMPQALSTATGAMAFLGLNAGPQAGGGIAGLVGYMR